MKEIVNILKEEWDIGFESKIVIGDPSYFGEYDHLTYNKSFRGKNSWKGKLILNKEMISDDDFSCENISFKLIFAPNDTLMDIYQRGKMVKTNK